VRHVPGNEGNPFRNCNCSNVWVISPDRLTRSVQIAKAAAGDFGGL
jgi:hypothetical protein